MDQFLNHWWKKIVEDPDLKPAEITRAFLRIAQLDGPEKHVFEIGKSDGRNLQ